MSSKAIKIIDRLLDFLEARKSKDNVSHTFVPWLHNGRYIVGRFFVPQSDRDELYRLFHDAVSTGRSIPLTEQPGNIAPLRVDIDLRLTEMVDTITDDYVDNIINCIARDEKCYVLSKPPRKCVVGDKDVIKHGVHLHFPDKIVNSVASKQIREHVIHTLGDRLYPDNDCVIKTKLTDVYDIASAVNNWFMYGGRKTDETEGWRICRVVNGEMGATMVRELSILETPEWSDKNIYAPVYERKPKSDVQDTSDVSVKSIGALVNLLDKSRADGYDTWRDICFSVLNIRDKYLLNVDDVDDLLHEWSAQSEKYDARSVSRHLVGFSGARREKRYGIPFLKMAAKTDNPDGYAEIMSPYIDEAIYNDDNQSLQISLAEMLACDETDGVRDLLERLTCGKFKVINKGGNYLFYHHNGIRWVPDNDWRTSRVHTYITRIQKSIANAIENLVINPLNKEETADIRKSLIQNDKKLRGYAFQKSCVESSLRVFFDENFRSNLNLKNNHLIAFENGVYDLDENIFRGGVPEDYLSLTTGYNYAPDRIPEIQAEISKVFRDIFSTEAEYQYFVSCVSLFLHGDRGRTNNNLLWLYGETGSNGKSTLVALISLMFGGYYTPLSSTIYTNPKFSYDPNAPNPVLAETRGKRFAEIGEIQDDSTLYSGMLKTLTSGTDRIRPLDKFEKGEDGISFVPQFGQIAYSNTFPKIKASASDGGLTRRMNTMKLIYEFVDTPTAPHHRQKDVKLLSRFSGEVYKQQLFLFFLGEYNSVRHLHGIPKPEEIGVANQEMLDEHSALAEFLGECVDFTDELINGKNVYVSSQDLFRALTLSDTRDYRPNQKQFTRDLKARGITVSQATWGPHKNRSVFVGMKLRDPECNILI